MELIGMSLGSLLLGSLADRIGRRATILSCLCVMAVGMLPASTSTGIVTLWAGRMLTGLGIGSCRRDQAHSVTIQFSWLLRSAPAC